MRDILTTPFWHAMAQALPQGVRHRYLPQLKSAENFELMLDQAAQAWKSLAGLLRTRGFSRRTSSTRARTA